MGYIISNSLQGKLLEIHFSSVGKICGAEIQTCKLFSLNTLLFGMLLPDYNFINTTDFISPPHVHVDTIGLSSFWTVFLEKVVNLPCINSSW